MSLYQVIVAEAFLSTLWPLKYEVTATAMQLFGGYDMALAATCSVVGVMLAAMVLWAAGGLIHLRLCKHTQVKSAAERAENRQFFKSILGVLLLLLLWMPMGFAVALAAGFLRVPLWRVAGLGLMGCAAYYTSTLMWL